MPILLPDLNNLDAAAAKIRAGGLVAFPTETVYGLGAHALDPDAVAQIFELKRRPRFDPLIVHVDSFEQLEQLAITDSEYLQPLAQRFWPGALTLVLPARALVPGIVTSGLDTVAIRMPSHWIARELLARSKCPIAAPSANPFGFLSPTKASHVATAFAQEITEGLILIDGGDCEIGVESTVVDLCSNPPRILRPGGIGFEALRSSVPGLVYSNGKAVGNNDGHELSNGPASPGMLSSHYAPRTRLVRVEWGEPILAAHAKKVAQHLAHREPAESVEATHKHNPASNTKGATFVSTIAPQRIAAIVFDRPRAEALHAAYPFFGEYFYLSSRGDVREAAHRLFSLLHEADAAGFEELWIEPCGRDGLGLAIDDRIMRAAKADYQ